MNRLRRSGRPAVLARGPGVIRYGAAGLLNALGTGVFYPYALLVFQEVARLPLRTVGIVLTVAAFAALPAMSLVGRAVDRAGPRTVLVVASLSRAAAFVGYVALPGVLPFLLISVLVAIANRAEQVASPALAVALAPDGQAGRWLALSRAVFNAGIGGGALIASAFVGHGRTGFLVLTLANAVSFLATALLHGSLPAGRSSAESGTADGHRKPDPPWRTPRFLRVSLITATLWAVALAVEAALPVVVIVQLGQPAWVAGTLFAVNTALLALCHVPVGAALTRHDPWRVLAVGALLHGTLAVAFLVVERYAVALLLVLLLVGMVGYTLGELVAAQAGLVLLTELPPPARRGRHLAFHQMLVGAAGALVPVVVTALLARWPAVLWWGVLALSALAAGSARTVRGTTRQAPPGRTSAG
ncbi:MFS transporter [Plantactinospora sonchi]|uniref:MFS transporter n=1 Tax=Plantactinospora sonchi TaxID=1544735 RepID=A0ABU7RQB6_9ACTN